MKLEDFNALVQQQLEKLEFVLQHKGECYAHGDRLSNFKKAAKLNNETPEKALWGMVAKHIIALSDYIEELTYGTLTAENEWEEKITDIQNYLLLLLALIKERYGEEV